VGALGHPELLSKSSQFCFSEKLQKGDHDSNSWQSLCQKRVAKFSPSKAFGGRMSKIHHHRSVYLATILMVMFIMSPIESKSVWGLATSKLPKKKTKKPKNKQTLPKRPVKKMITFGIQLILHFTLSNIFMFMTLFNFACLLV
jgi:hypothetical protein